MISPNQRKNPAVKQGNWQEENWSGLATDKSELATQILCLSHESGTDDAAVGVNPVLLSAAAGIEEDVGQAGSHEDNRRGDDGTP